MLGVGWLWGDTKMTVVRVLIGSFFLAKVFAAVFVHFAAELTLTAELTAAAVHPVATAAGGIKVLDPLLTHHSGLRSLLIPVTLTSFYTVQAAGLKSSKSWA